VFDPEPDIAATTVALTLVAADDPGGLEHPEVVRQQVRRQSEQPGQLAGRQIVEYQVIDDMQPDRVAQCGVKPRPLSDVRQLDPRGYMLNLELSQSALYQLAKADHAHARLAHGLRRRAG
jgi:hypothetical protein